MDTAQRGSIAPKHAHDAIAPQQAVDLVLEHVPGTVSLRHVIASCPLAASLRAIFVTMASFSDPPANGFGVNLTAAG